MDILWLGPKNEVIEKKLFEEHHDTLTFYEDRLYKDSEILKGKDFVVSFGYRYIIPMDVINLLNKRIINLHISYLPWNKGADPNFWSIVEGTKKGVTIHYIDEGLDTGDIIAQKEVALEPSDTLRTSYTKLVYEIERLFLEKWEDIRINRISVKPQNKSEGSFHYKKDIKLYEDYLIKGWDTPIQQLIGLANKRTNIKQGEGK
ncbi:formyltransferase family protein [Paenibacillus sp. JJ-223]|uniref:formyltransferase family protein n=1 Tax=Paenibacillus sp. JJ-223 TaxID=2905647 RepID=UPI001F2C3FA2|nr:formyltransferase family protein [Paenibacillus sp. JJ-223]CAH1223787.1 Linear gramicidin synthase subunit A [Paenibacillus sp. JJ-223]